MVFHPPEGRATSVVYSNAGRVRRCDQDGLPQVKRAACAIFFYCVCIRTTAYPINPQPPS